jgi:transposase
MPFVQAPGEPDFAAFVAIDWADRKHTWALQSACSGKRETGTLEHTAEAIEAWALQLATRFDGRPVAVALEQARGALLYALSKYQHLVLYPIHPSTSHDYRKAMHPSGCKDDPRDAEILLDLLTLHRNRLRVLQPDLEATRKLQVLVEKRRQLVDERTAHTNRLTDQLKVYFPQVLEWFDRMSAPIVAAFLARWPTLPVLQQESPEAVRTFFRQHHSGSEPRMEQRLAEIKEAKPLLEDGAIIEPAVLIVRTLLAVVAALNQGIRELEKCIEQVAAAHPDYVIFSSFPAAGPAMAPRLVAAFGSRRERYRTASEMQAFSGIAPVRESSGQQCWIHFRWSCPKFLRQTFHEYAGLSIQHCNWARAFYDQQRARGKNHHAAVRSLAFKWIRILFRCWQSRQSYKEDTYIRAREHRSLPSPPPQSTASCSSGLRYSRGHCGKAVDSGLKSAREIFESILQEG